METRQISSKHNMTTLFKNPVFAAFLASIALLTITFVYSPQAFNVNAIAGILAFTMLLSIAASGQTLVIMTGGIDMSVGAMMSLTAVLAGEVMYGRNEYILPAILVCLLIGAICGLFNGVGVVYCSLPPIIMTLCFAGILSRMQFAITGGTPNGTAAPLINDIMVYRVFGAIPMIAIIGLVFFVIMFYLLNHSKFGIQLFLTGNNETAAHFSGIKTKQVKVLAYVLCGVLSGLGGFITCAYMHHVACNIMDAYTMNSVAAVVVGGTLLSGGKGSYLGSVVGALLLTVLSNFLSVLNTSPSVQNIVMGVVLISLLAMYNRSPKIRM